MRVPRSGWKIFNFVICNCILSYFQYDFLTVISGFWGLCPLIATGALPLDPAGDFRPPGDDDDDDMQLNLPHSTKNYKTNKMKKLKSKRICSEETVPGKKPWSQSPVCTPLTKSWLCYATVGEPQQSRPMAVKRTGLLGRPLMSTTESDAKQTAALNVVID